MPGQAAITIAPASRLAGLELGSVAARDDAELSAPNTALGLRWAIVTACPFYAPGGLIMLGAARYYPRDIAYVIAHSRRSWEAPAAGQGPAA